LNNLRRIVALAAALTVSMIPLAAPPVAAVTSSETLTTTNAILYPGCRYHPYTLTIDNSEVAHGWSFDATIYGPDGLEVSSDFMYGEATDVPAQGDFLLCASDPAGRYTLGGTFESTDNNYDSHSHPVAAVTFTVRRPHSRTSLSTSKLNARYGEAVTLRSVTKDERPNGYYATQYATVVLQKYSGGRWVKVAARTTNQYGRASWRYVFKSRTAVKFRAVTRADGYQGSTSSTIRIY
jgi:hypothetical protein